MSLLLTTPGIGYWLIAGLLASSASGVPALLRTRSPIPLLKALAAGLLGALVGGYGLGALAGALASAPNPGIAFAGLVELVVGGTVGAALTGGLGGWIAVRLEEGPPSVGRVLSRIILTASVALLAAWLMIGVGVALILAGDPRAATLPPPPGPEPEVPALQRFVGHTTMVSALALSPDGQSIFVGLPSEAPAERGIRQLALTTL
jgi:hypothetical protein